MAIRNIVKVGDDVLAKKCRPVTEFNDRLFQLLEDMHDTLTEAAGAGLAAPQVGILKRCVVIDVGEGRIELVNPKIIEEEGSQIGTEGCLSVPGQWGEVERPMKVTVEAFDRHGKKFTIEGEELLARAFCHELDHLEGKLFLDKVIRFIED